MDSPKKDHNGVASRVTNVDAALLACWRKLDLQGFVALVHAATDSKGERDALYEEVRKHSQESSRQTCSGLPEQLRETSAAAVLRRLGIKNVALERRIQGALLRAAREEELWRLREESAPRHFDALNEISAEDLRMAIEQGTIVNAVDRYGHPQEIVSDENYSAPFTDTPIPTKRLSATVLNEVLREYSSPDPSAASAQGLRLRQTVIYGHVDLGWADFSFPLHFEGCDFHEWVWLDNLRVPQLQFTDCDFTPRGPMAAIYAEGSVSGNSMAVEGAVSFDRCNGIGQIFIPEAKIGKFRCDQVGRVVPAAERVATEQTPRDLAPLRLVANSAEFGMLIVPDPADARISFESGRPLSMSAHHVGALAEGQKGDPAGKLYDNIVVWLNEDWNGRETHETLWNEMAAALERTGWADKATDLRIAHQRYKNRSRGSGPLNAAKRWFNTVFLDWTSAYFYRPQRVIAWLLGVLLVTWFLAFVCYPHLQTSPLVSELGVVSSWLEGPANASVWALIYALDSTFAPLNLGLLEVVWPEFVWLALVFSLLKAASVMLLGILVVAVTNRIAERFGRS